jgi:hypothetical protein
VFGVTPTARSAKVLRDETHMPADTVAKDVGLTTREK